MKKKLSHGIRISWLLLGLFWMVALAVVGLSSGCGKQQEETTAGPTVTPSKERFPKFTGVQLEQGREVFINYCKLCHETGREDAPILGNVKQWTKRLPQGPDVLIKHAIEGYHGPSGTEMPARGGFPDLTDEEVAAAVHYMIRAVQQ